MIEAREGHFYDNAGRQVILHGLNYVNKDPASGYMHPEADGLFREFRAWGFNCLRLGLIWDGLEPQPGVYNETYLQAIRRRLDLAGEAGLYVFLDMHQDLYSSLYSDGAPAWATLSGGQSHIGGEVWSDAYMSSPAVQAAIDNFWRNAPAPGPRGLSEGDGLQDRLIACWRLLAERFGKHPAVIGYDLYNEPMMGSEAPKAMSLQFARGAELLASEAGAGGDEEQGSSDPAEAMLELWGDPEGRARVLRGLDDPQVYAELMEAPRPVYNEFERKSLMPFYRRAAKAIRSADERGIIFLEASMGSNMGVISAIEAIPGAGPQAYAPHGYDLVVDTPAVAQASSSRVGLIFSRHDETARRLGLPMLVGEWGAYGSWPGTLPAARAVASAFERSLCSDTYWEYQPGFEKADCFPAVSRPYPERVAGSLESYRYDEDRGSFECSWTEDPAIGEATEIYLPAWLGFDPSALRLSPPGECRAEELGSGAFKIVVAPCGGSARRELSAAAARAGRG